MLQGTLNDFTLADVFSLLALTKKTGALRISADGTDGQVLFREGLICLALSDAKRVPLGARLVSAGLIDAEQVRSTVERNAGSSVAVTEALLSLGQVEDRVLAVYLREQIVDAVFELMRLDEGSFSFDAGAPALSRGVGLSVVDVVGEANRRLDEWQSIHQRIAAPNAVVAMVPTAPGSGDEHVTLSAEQWELLALIDGRRTVAEVVELTGRGEFATCRVLGDLVDAGLIQAQDPAASGSTDLARLIAAREALRALERVEQTGINPRLSSAAPLGETGSRIRWVEPPTEGATQPATRPALMQSRSRLADVAAVADESSAASATPPVEPEVEPAPAVQAAVPGSSAPESSEPASSEPASPEPEPAEDVVADEPDAPVASPSGVDRAQVARELASLGSNRDDASADSSRLTRDDDVNKGLLLRLIDGVKGA